MTFIDGARVTKHCKGVGWCALLSKQISLQLPQERAQCSGMVILWTVKLIPSTDSNFTDIMLCY